MAEPKVNLDYIRGFADGEGCVYFRKRGNTLEKAIQIFNTDYKLVRKISNVLNKVGIKHIIVRRITSKNYKTCWAIYIRTYGAIKRYYELIGFCSSDKQKKLEKIIKFGKEKGYKKLGRIELISKIWKLKNKKLSQAQIARSFGVNKIFIHRVLNKTSYAKYSRV